MSETPNLPNFDNPDEMAATANALGYTDEQVEQVHRFFSESKAFRDTGDRDKYIDLLLQTPGLDPVLAVADGHPDDIPKSGWIIHANIAPGYGGVIELHKYQEGGLELKPPEKDGRSEWGQYRLHYGLTNGASHTVAYENPNYPHKNTQPYDRMSQSTYTGRSFGNTQIEMLSNGGRLLDDAEPMSYGHNLFTSMDWNDYSTPDRRKHMPDMQVNRVVAGVEEVGHILVNLGFGMGLEDVDVKQLVTVVGSKTTPVA